MEGDSQSLMANQRLVKPGLSFSTSLYQGDSIPEWPRAGFPGRQEFEVHGRGRLKSKTNLRRQEEKAVPGRRVGSANKSTFLREIQRLRGHEEKAV